MAAVLPLLLLLGLYFVMMSQRRRAQAQRSLPSTLSPGDRVVSAGGLIGTLQSVEGDRATVEIAPGVVIELLAAALVRRLEPAVNSNPPAYGEPAVNSNPPAYGEPPVDSEPPAFGEPPPSSDPTPPVEDPPPHPHEVSDQGLPDAGPEAPRYEEN